MHCLQKVIELIVRLQEKTAECMSLACRFFFPKTDTIMIITTPRKSFYVVDTHMQA